MLTNTVSESGKNFYYNTIVGSLNQQLQDLTYQISTGKKAKTFGDLGTGAITSLSLHAQDTQITGYVAAINDAKLNTDQMDTSMTGITNDINNVLAQFNKITQGAGVPDMTILQSTAQTALADVYSMLNSSLSGKYVFGANQTNKPPIADTTAAGTNIATQLATYPGGTSPATIIANITALTNVQMGYDPGLAAAGNVTLQADANSNLNYTVKADENQFKNVIAGLNEIVGLTYNAGQSGSFWTLFNDAKSRLVSANSATSLRQGQLGVVRNQMAALLTSHQSTQNTLAANIGTIEDADLASASSTLQTLQTQIQATYSTINQVSKLSILDYLH